MANYDATGLKNAVIYTFNTAVKEAGLELRDFKLNSIKVNRENRISGGYEYNATLTLHLEVFFLNHYTQYYPRSQFQI